MNLSVIMNEEITDDWMDKMIELDQKIFPPVGNDALSPDYIRSLYKDSKEGLIFVIDQENNQLAGYMTFIFIDEVQRDDYLNGGHYSELRNVKMTKNKNIMYLYTIAVSEAYRGTPCMKMMGRSLVKWLDEKEKEGFEVREVYAEAVSVSGAKSVSKGFEMEPMKDVDSQGIGHYQSLDGLRKYREKMKMN